MNSEELKERTMSFGLRILRMTQKLPTTKESDIISRQIIRSGFSVGANYRAVCRAKSSNDFINKLKVVLEESDESVFWLQVIGKAKIASENKMESLLKEGEELTAIFASALITASRNYKNTQSLKSKRNKSQEGANE